MGRGNREVSHYVVTSHPSGGVLHSVKCRFLGKDVEDVVIGKSQKLEVRQLRAEEDEASPFPLVFSCPVNGRITGLVPLCLPDRETDLLFVTTDQYQYAVIGFDDEREGGANAGGGGGDLGGGCHTLASGSLRDDWTVLGTLSECGPLVAVDPHARCIVLHLYDGLVTVFPIVGGSRVLGSVFHARLEERTVLDLTILHHLDGRSVPPHLALLHQDPRGAQHVSTHAIDLPRAQLWTKASSAGQPHHSRCEWLSKSRIDGGSSLLLPVPPRAPPAAAIAKKPAAAGTTAPVSPTPPPPPSGGVVVLGQRQITYCSLHSTKVMPIPPAMILSWDVLPSDVSGMPRYLLGDEFGNLHMLTLLTQGATVVALQLDTLGSCTLSQTLNYLDQGLVFCGSCLGDSQLVQIHDEPIPLDDLPEEDDVHTDRVYGGELADTTYLTVVEEYVHLGPIVDFDLVPMAGSGEQSQVVTASGSSKSGTIRVIRNGIGMTQHAAVELGGIQNMWSLRKSFEDPTDAYLVQSFVGETRVLGVSSSAATTEDDAMDEDGGPGEQDDDDVDIDDDDEDVGGTLEEVVLPSLESYASTLNCNNLVGNLILQVTESQIRLCSADDGSLLDTHQPDSPMTVATSNEAGQILVAERGGTIHHWEVVDRKLVRKATKTMDREVSCLDLQPFLPPEAIANPALGRTTRATLCAVGLWDDFTVRILGLESSHLHEMVKIHLDADHEDGGADPHHQHHKGEGEEQRRNNRNNTMARSLCLITLDSASSSSSSGGSSQNSSRRLAPTAGVDMLFVGLGDGTLFSFCVNREDAARVRVQSRKEVSLGTQRIHLVPLQNEKGGSCVLATGDRPTVIYLAGTSSAAKNHNPKLCYSSVNLSPSDDPEEAAAEAGGEEAAAGHNHDESVSVNVATPFFSPLLFGSSAGGEQHYSLCVADDSHLRLGVIDDIQKLHVTSYRLGMAPRRIVHCPEGRMFAVGCIESGIKQVGVGGGEMNMGNCVRFLDDTAFDDIHRIDLEPCEMIMSMASVSLKIHRNSPGPQQSVGGEAMASADSAAADGEHKTFLVVGTAYALHDEDEPTKGRVMVLSCNPEETNDANHRSVQSVAELQVRGGVYSMCQFYDGKILVTVNSKTQMCKLVDEGTGALRLSIVGVGHHGHILSLFVASRARKALGPSPNAAAMVDIMGGSSIPAAESKEEAEKQEQLAVVGDLMRSISLVQYYPEHDTIEEVARDFNANWTTAVSMLTDNVYIGGENWNNLFVLRRNTKATSEEVRCRLDTVGEFHLGEMVNKFMSGSLVMRSSNESSSGSSSNRRRSLASPKKSDSGKASASASGAAAGSRSKRPGVVIGSQTLFGTVDGTLGSILGLDGPTSAFFACLERSMQRVVRPVGNFSHQKFRAFNAEQRHHPSHGFIDGDLVESFLDLDKTTMGQVVREMNRDGGWEADDLAFASGGDKNDAMEDDNRPELAVDDVLAVVEEMTMLH